MKTVREFMAAHRRLTGERRVQAWLDSRRWCSAQDDLSVANAAGASVRADINSNLQALGSLMSGSSAPATTYAHMLWADTGNNVLKKRNAANGAWIVVRTLDESFVLSRGSNTILALSDVGKCILATAAFTQTLTAAATLGDGWWCAYSAQGNSIVLDPNSTETIDGATTKTVTGSGMIFCNGSNFFTVGFQSFSPITASLGSDVSLTNNTIFFDGPSIAQGTAGTWFVVGTVTVFDPAVATMIAKLWDGTTLIKSAVGFITLAGAPTTITLAGYITNPAGNLRISVKDPTTVDGKMLFNNSSLGNDCNITAIRITL